LKKLLLLSALLIFACSSDDEGNPCIYEPTLSTEAVTDITETSATLNGVIAIVSDNCDVPNNAEQGFVYSTEIQPTLDDIQVNVNGTNISDTVEGLLPNTTYYVRSFLTNNLGDFYGNEVEFTTTEVCDVVYLDDNGVTIKACESANIGDIGIINGVEYTVVDREMLELMIENEEDITVVCTTKISDMSKLFRCNSGFNQPIGNWDVSNVTNMQEMFSKIVLNDSGFYDSWCDENNLDEDFVFNQDISNWDVSNVTNMDAMLTGQNFFNQAVGNWDVSNVTHMNYMFNDAHSFNQPIGDWDVSNITYMGYMFYNAHSFNQPIGDWDVSNVIYMGYMFFDVSSFNQDLSNWDVSNVTNMDWMFSKAWSFNQDISSWDVSNVTQMSYMFRGSVNGTSLVFNQDLSSWDVTNVFNCLGFCNFNDSWTLPKPNFNEPTCTQGCD
jgi:surface protein